MYGNGVVIGMEVIQVTHRQIHKDLLRAPTESGAVALGTTSRGTAVFPVAATTIRRTGAMASASASPSSVSLTCCFLSGIAKLERRGFNVVREEKQRSERSRPCFSTLTE